MSDTPGQTSTGGQQPTNEPHGGQTSAEAAGSVRDRLRSPVPSSQANTGGDSRRSGISDSTVQPTDSRGELAARGRDERQHDSPSGPEGRAIQEPRREDLDPSVADAAERKVAALFLLSFLGVVGFFVVFWFVPYHFEQGRSWVYYTPLLGLTMAVAIGGIGAGAVQWAKSLMSAEEAVQERHGFASLADERSATAAALVAGAQETQLGRRRLLRNTLLLGAGSMALLPLPFLFDLGPYAHKEQALAHTPWAKGVRLLRQNGSPIRLGDLQIGSFETVYPDVPGGDRLGNAPTMLIRMRPQDLKLDPARRNWVVDGHIAYSMICTHVGCPVKLYEQQTHLLLCPCHQSTFDAADMAKVVFGPAARPLPQLAIALDAEGYFVAQHDYTEPIGPSYWERA